MTTISATKARSNFYEILNQVNVSSEPVILTNSKGKNAVLVGEDDWNAICETIYLNNIPGLVQSIIDGGKTCLDDCIEEKDLDW